MFRNKQLESNSSSNPSWQHPWTLQEQQKLLDAVAKLGPKWSKISDKFFPKRSPNQLRCKHAYLQRMQQRQQSAENTESKVGSSGFEEPEVYLMDLEYFGDLFE
ncbi:Myb-like_DNA-binding domain-containing protein [Hexamita inflata]|uniref:Myb-like DNA-binding domain-containing protein n=1 Tax=Hexamita inflata TaxID=28002 RepID=A0AA86RJU1_9EUKA|nr:Myb-like DNA-binding domain-containing protein [Hexamita inflata]